MIGLVFLLCVILAIGGIAVIKLGWKEALTAASVLAAGLWAGGQQMADAMSAFVGSIF